MSQTTYQYAQSAMRSINETQDLLAANEHNLQREAVIAMGATTGGLEKNLPQLPKPENDDQSAVVNALSKEVVRLRPIYIYADTGVSIHRCHGRYHAVKT